MLWTAISKKRVRLKEAVISQALPLSVKLPIVSLFGLGHSSTSSFCELNILLISISFLDDWFIAVGSTSCVYPASPRYGFLVLTSNNKSLSFWVYILVYFLMKGKFFSCYFQMKIFLTSVECESGLKFVENFVFVYVGTYFPCPKSPFFFFFKFFFCTKNIFMSFGYRFFILMNSACEKPTSLLFVLWYLASIRLTFSRWIK